MIWIEKICNIQKDKKETKEQTREETRQHREIDFGKMLDEEMKNIEINHKR